jgi:ABC-type Fe3+/spermidine/putrescine transport system ATPase subunit
MQKQLNVTTIFVTHDVEEAEEIGDNVAVIINGELRQVGTPGDVFSSPVDDEVADLIGSQNILTCSSYRHIGGELYEVNCKGTRIVVACEGSIINKIAIPAKEIYFYNDKPAGPKLNTYKGTILKVSSSSSVVKVRVKVGENTLLAELPKDLFNSLGLAEGKEVFLRLKLKSIRTYP